MVDFNEIRRYRDETGLERVATETQAENGRDRCQDDTTTTTNQAASHLTRLKLEGRCLTSGAEQLRGMPPPGTAN